MCSRKYNAVNSKKLSYFKGNFPCLKILGGEYNLYLACHLKPFDTEIVTD